MIDLLYRWKLRRRSSHVVVESDLRCDCVSGIASQLWAGHTIVPLVTALCVVGGTAGLFAGQQLGRRLSGPVLQKVFVIAILAVAIFVIVRNLSR